MQRDQKVGFALAILLIGIVAALFFRNEPNETAGEPTLKSPEKLDSQIAERPLGPYLIGLETFDAPDVVESNSKGTTNQFRQSAYEDLPDFLRDDANDVDSNAQLDPFADSPKPPPDPIRIGDDSRPSPTIKPVAVLEQNKKWKVVEDAPSKPSRPTAIAKSIAKAKARSKVAANSKAGFRTHLVKKGETLSQLAVKYLGNSLRFLEIYEANRDVMKTPNDLRSGLKIKIPPTDDIARRQSTNDRGAAATQDDTKSKRASKQNSTGKVDKKAKKEKGRFEPARRSPIVPGRRRTSALDGAPETRVKSLTQIPPDDLPKLK